MTWGLPLVQNLQQTHPSITNRLCIPSDPPITVSVYCCSGLPSVSSTYGCLNVSRTIWMTNYRHWDATAGNTLAEMGRNDPKSKGRLPWTFEMGRPSPARRQLNLRLNVAADHGHSLRLAGIAPKTAASSCTMSGGSTRAAWCLADRPQVFGSLMRKSANRVPGAASVGNIRSNQRPAPQRTESGRAGWCWLGSSASQANAKSHACPSCFLRAGRAAAIALMVSANFPYAFPEANIFLP